MKELCPKYTILVPNYNYGLFLKSAIDSIISQTFTNWELIFIDDCSTDNSIEIFKQYNDERLRIIQHEKNVGNVLTFTDGINAARGKYLSILSADDIYDPQYLQEIDFFLENNSSVRILYTDFYRINKEGIITNRIKSKYAANSGVYDELNSLLYNCHIAHCTVMMEIKLLKEAGGYDQSFPKTCDWLLWLHVAKGNVFGYIDKPLYKYRIHGNNMSASIRTVKQISDEAEKIINNFFKSKDIPQEIKFAEISVKNHHLFNKGTRYIAIGEYRNGLSFIFKVLRKDKLVLFKRGNIRNLASSIYKSFFAVWV